MLDFYAWPTPNGYKVSILLEELGIPYRVIPIDIGRGDQFDPEFLKISPNNKIPAIVDPDGPGGRPYALFESGAILMYLAEKTGKLLPADIGSRYRVIQWLMFQMGGIGPMMVQANHFQYYAPERIPYAIDRYVNETRRLFGAVERALAESEYLAGDYSIADIASFPWLRGYPRQGLNIEEFPNVKRWLAVIEARPAVQRGLQLLAEARRSPDQPLSDEERQILFGDRQYQRR